MNTRYIDCYSNFNNNTLIVGNKNIEREIKLYKNNPISNYIFNKKSGYKWNGNNDIQLFRNPLINFNNCNITVNSFVSNNNKLSNNFLLTEILFNDGISELKYTLKIFPTLPFISNRLYVKLILKDNLNYKMDLIEDIIEAFPISNKHLKLEIFRLFDKTDENDTLVKKIQEVIYPYKSSFYSGDLFIINNYLDKEGLIIVKDSPTIESSLNRREFDLKIEAEKSISLHNSGLNYNKLIHNEYIPCYGNTIGVGQRSILKRLYKKYYSNFYLGNNIKKLFIMSNNWGDRNQDKNISEDFILKELEEAKNLDIDIVQIDDGWQKGITCNSALSKGGVWEDYYNFDNNFWEINKEKFPNGFKLLANYCLNNNLKLGLWFSPDSSNNFINWEQDAKLLLDLYEKYNITYFKLDEVKIRNKKCELNFIKLLNKITFESNNQITINFDITAEKRFGYLYEKHFGTIFVENRYTDYGSYYPHNTLKNLWQLAEILPTKKFQFELLNNKRNIDKYKGDLLSPSNYSIDYLFASVMVANPLLWMEMSNLEFDDKELLTNIISVYKKERKAIFFSEVLPVGELPDGVSFTGFQIKKNNNQGYFLFFREYTESPKYYYNVYDLKGKKLFIEILYSNKAIENLIVKQTNNCNNIIEVHLPYKRSFVFVKYKID